MLLQQFMFIFVIFVFDFIYSKYQADYNSKY